MDGLLTRQDENSVFDVDFATYPIAFMLLDYIAYDVDMTLQ